MSALFWLDEMTAVCPKCFIRSVSFTTNKCPNCAYNYKRETPDRFVEAKKKYSKPR